MNRKQVLASAMLLQGRLQKKSESYLPGFQERQWKVLQGGTKIGYRKVGEEQFHPDKTWKVLDLRTEQVQEECCFLLHTPKRSYELRAESVQMRKTWMRAIEVLKRELKKKLKPSKGNMIARPGMNTTYPSPDSTLPSIDPFNPLNVTSSIMNQTSSGLNQSLPPRYTSVTASKLTGSFCGSKTFLQDELKEKFGEMLKKMAAPYASFHVLVVRLTTKSKDFFSNNSSTNYYILFSSKSLAPEEWISEENLTSAQLPHWADPDCLYRIEGTEGRLVLKMETIAEISQSDLNSSLSVTTPKERLQFYCESLSARKNIKQSLQIGRINALQCLSSLGSRKNYDTLIQLHGSNVEQFNTKVTAMMGALIPQGHSFQPQVIKKLMDNLCPFIIEVIGNLQRKVIVPTAVIVDILRAIHEQVRKHLKLVWDSCAGKARGADILHILKSMSSYQSIVNRHVKDSELDDALKELSKLYMRACFRNFETIILGIVLQEKKDNYFRVQQSEAEGRLGAESEGHLATHAITDLFKFIYDVFELAIPCWNNRLHLHNINRLAKRALSVFVRELRATVDQQEISPHQLIAISNNYVAFSEEVEEFYECKLSQLKEQTKQAYDQLRDEYREVAMIVVDKLVLPLKIQLKIYFQKQTLYTASLQQTYKKIAQSGVKQLAKQAHFIFRKRYFQRVFATIREELCRMVQKQAKKVNKKKPDTNRVIQRVEIYKRDCLEMAMLLAGSKMKLERELDQLKIILTTPKKEQIRTILTESPEFYKRVYKNILVFRADYYEGSPLYQYVATLQSQPQLRVPEQDRHRRSSFSKYYIQEMQRNSVTSSLEKPQRQRSQSGEQKLRMGEQKLRMISQGFVRRAKATSGTYEDIYLKLKKSILYIYQNERMERCQNTVQIQSIQQITVPHPEKPSFIITFSALHRSKQMRIKCSSIQECNRWVYTLQSELRRISNDKRMKKGVKIREKKSRLVIDYDELMNGTDYFSYNT